MPIPLKKNYNIGVQHVKRPADYAMRSTDVYTDFYGIGYIVSGDRQVITPDGIYFVSPGDIGITNIGVYHRTAPASSMPYERYGVKFTPKIVEHLKASVGEETFLEFMSHAGYHLPLPAQKKVEQIFADMLYEFDHYDSHSELVLEGMLNHLIITILRNRILHTLMDSKINVQDDVIMDILAYLDVHYMENPSIDELAKQANLSRAQFMKRFKQAIGSSYKTYLNCYKIHHAQNLLANTSRSVSEIAEELGFCNANYFCNVFTDIVGQSPTGFRKSC